MKRFKLKDKYYKLIDGFEVNESSREVKYSNVKIDFTGKGIQDLPLKYQQCQLVDADVVEKKASEGTTIEGSSFSIDYDKDREFEIQTLKGQTTQSGTPTPTSPQPINITTGRQVVSVCEKNLFDKDNITNGIFYDTTDGHIINTGVWSQSQFIGVNGGEKITISSCYNVVNNSYQISQFNESKQWLQGEQFSLNTSKTYTLNANAKYIRIGFRNDRANINIQIEKGNQATTYEEYKGNDYEINLGKNLFETMSSSTSQGVTLTPNSDGSYTLNGKTTGVAIFNKTLTTQLPPGTYTVSYESSVPLASDFFVRIRKANGTMLVPNGIPSQVVGNNTTTNKTTFTSTDYGAIVAINLVTTGITYNNVNVKIQLEKGTGTSYAPYKTPIYLGKIGNYQDYINKSTGKNLLQPTLESGSQNGITYVVNNGGSITLNGTSTSAFDLNIYNSQETKIVENGKQYTYSIGVSGLEIKVREFRRQGHAIAVFPIAQGQSPSITFTPEQRGFGQMVSISIPNNQTFNNLTIYPQIEEGQASDFEPYGEGQWYIHKEIGRYEFLGTENFSASQWGTNSWDLDNVISTTWNTNELQIMSNIFKGVAHKDRSSSGNNIIYTFSNTGFEIRNTPYSTLTDIRNVTKGSYIYWVLKTPTTTLIEDEELINQLNSIELLEGTNNIVITSNDLPLIMKLHYNFNNEDIEIVTENEVIYTGYVNNYTLPKMKNKLEYRELDIDLLSPLALATLRTADAVGSYNLQDLVKEIIQPLIDDGFTLKELNISNTQINVNYLTETIESSLNKLSNKFNFWWYIDKNKNIYINDINYIFSKERKAIYNDSNKINGLIDFTPKMESIDYCNTLDFTNVRLITKSSYIKDYVFDYDPAYSYYRTNYYNPIFNLDTISPGDEITFDIPFIINTNRKGNSQTMVENDSSYFKLEKIIVGSGGSVNYETLVDLTYNENNEVIIPSNVAIADSYNEDKEFVFVRDNFFSNLIVGMKYNGSSAFNVGKIYSETALMWTKIRINDDEEISTKKDLISETGIIEKQIDMNEQWLLYEDLVDISNSLIRKDSVNVELVELKTDIENNYNVGDIIEIDKPGFLTYGRFIITDKKRSYYDNVDSWIFSIRNTNILESYIDLFRAREEEEYSDRVYNLISSDYSVEGIKEGYEVEIL